MPTSSSASERRTLAGPARQALIDAYARGASIDVRAIDLHSIVALLRLTFEPFRSCDPRWPERIDEQLDLIERCLEVTLR